ncbi:MAG: hypothetical protein NTY09_08110 [bacterium]|nr:hypothetical protein [bacterium]
MLFPTTIFIFLFGPITIVGYWLIKNDKLRRIWILVASYVFYGWWDPRFIVLLWISTLVTYFGGLKVFTTTDPVIRKRWFLFALCADLGMLLFFKYAMLLMGTWNVFIHWVGVGPAFPAYTIILPIGISFFTFQTMSYTIDVYRRKLDASNDLLQYATFVALFPQLIAGPIVRYSEISATLKNLPKKLTNEYLNLGLFYFTVGLAKKVLIADRIAYFIDPMLTNYQNLTSSEAWIFILGFTVQIYFDFAGYSLMAIGLGYLIGFVFPQNFNSPFKAVSVSDFWRRWHMSLSSWLRDYLYIPLGGRDRRALALTVTMLLGGLWHGPEWTYLCWGAWNAIGLELHHRFKPLKYFPRNKVYAQIGMYFFFATSLVFFAPKNLGQTWVFFTKMLSLKILAGDIFYGHGDIPGSLLFILAVGLGWGMLGPNMVELVRERKAKPKPIWAVVVGILGAICILFLSETGPFLYWQF